ncbi:MAG: PAS domain S-box protein [Desulfobacterales bacterium]|nr:PAS domain S-box protein [Desulfobacterales bacterium]
MKQKFGTAKKPTYEELEQRVEELDREVDERKRVEELLRLSEQKFKELTEITTDWVWEVDAQGVYTYVSPKIKDLLGYEVSEVLGKTPFDLMPNEETERIRKFFNENVINEEPFYDLENVNRHKDGHLVALETSGIPIFDEKGQLKGYRGIDRNITKRKQAEEALKKAHDELERQVEERTADLVKAIEQLTREVKERKVVEEKLWEVRDYLENLFNYANAPIIVWNPEFKVTRFNHAFEYMTGYTADEVVGQTLHMLFPEASRHESLNKIRRTLSGEYWESVEIPILRKDGNIRLALWNSANIHTQEETTVVATIAQGTDITGRKQAEHALQKARDELERRVEERTAKLARANEQLKSEIEKRKRTDEALLESEEKYRVLFETAKDAIFVSDETGRFVDVNQAACDSLGYSKEELLRLSNREIDSDPRGYEAFLKVRGGLVKKITFEVNQQRKDGTLVPVEITGSLLKRGGQRMAVAIARDITRRKEAEKALRESEERFRTIFESAQACMFIKDSASNYVLANPAMELLLGLPASQLIGHTAEEIYEQQAAERLMQVDSRILGGESIEEEHTMLVKGTLMTFDISKVPMRDGSGQITGICGIARDITEKRNLEAQMQDVQKMEAIGTLAAGIAHDFNNMLSTIIGNAEIALCHEVPKGKSPQYSLEQVVNTGNRAKDLIRQILTFSRQDEQDRKPLRVVPIVKEALILLRASLPTTIEIRQDFKTVSDTVLADPTKIQQVLMNLCANAAYAMREKGGLLEVSVTEVDLSLEDVASMPDISPGSHLKLTEPRGELQS